MRSLIIHESCGALLTASGRSLSAVLTAVTVPESGANSSDTAFTDSMVPNAWPLVSVGADLGQLDVDDVAQLLLGEVGDADGALVALHLHPLVVVRVLQRRRIHRRDSYACVGRL